MAFQGTLEIDQARFNILAMDLSFHQPTDSTGKPCALPGGGKIALTVESTNNDVLLMQWMLSEDSVKSVSIIFASMELGKPRKIKLEKAYCVEYHEHFEAFGESPMKVSIILSAHKFTCGDAILDKNWTRAQSN